MLAGFSTKQVSMKRCCGESLVVVSMGRCDGKSSWMTGRVDREKWEVLKWVDRNAGRSLLDRVLWLLVDLDGRDGRIDLDW